MEIEQIKSSLDIREVLDHYHLRMDRWNRVCCPWHDDKRPSLQIYPKTNTWTCFSTKCGAGSGDVIEMIQRMDGSDKHTAIKKAKTFLTMTIPHESREVETSVNRAEILTKVFDYFKRSLRHSKTTFAREYMDQRGLRLSQTIGYNGGTLHRSKDENFIKACTELGLLKLSESGWRSWAKGCLIFPLLSESGQVVSFYGRSLESGNNRHFYLKNRQGLYPSYPKVSTKVLLLCESVIDAASLEGLDLGVNCVSVVALYGTNGLGAEHREAMVSLPDLEEIIFMLVGDEAGRKAVEHHAKTLKELCPKVQLTYVALPEGEDVNSMYVSHQKEAAAMFATLLAERRNIERQSIGKAVKTVDTAEQVSESGVLDTSNPELLTYRSGDILLTVMGGISIEGLDRLRVTLKMSSGDRLLRHGLDLYNDNQVEQYAKRVATRLDSSSREMRKLLDQLTNALEVYRMEQLEQRKLRTKPEKLLSADQLQSAESYLSAPNLMQRTLSDLAKTGIIGEPNNALLMYLAMSSRKRRKPIHVISLAKSGMGKTHLQERVAACIPDEEKLIATTLSDNALYYMQKEELKHKVLVIEDLDGAQNVLYAIREMQSKGALSKTVTLKDNKGRLKTMLLEVEGPICLIACTTKESLYEDNANRSFLIYLDSSADQDERIMAYQRKISAGLVNEQSEKHWQQSFQHMQYLLREVHVRNPFAEALRIPNEVFKPRRTNAHYLAFIELITWYHQYQRPWKTDGNGQRYIETTVEDIEWANKLLAPVLLRKSDELTGPCRDFLEALKKQFESQSFYRSDVRAHLRINPNNIKYYLRTLLQYGYVRVVGGNRYNRGYEYEIVNMQEYEHLQKQLDKVLQGVLEDIKSG